MVLAPWLSRALDARAGFVLALAPLAAFVWLVLQMPSIAAGGQLFESLPWVPGLGIALNFRLDGLSLLFALLISGIGTLIVLYAAAYLSDHHHLGRFYAYLLGFMASMLGLVLADDLVAMFVFWELTSVCSYLLITFQHERDEARRSGLQALLITGGGGLALLAGLLLLGLAGEAWQFSALSAQAAVAHPASSVIVALILLGCFTKSAQVPFHLWLPNAMVAPTPVSAYLHSATMVKAGVYLLARLNPIFGGEDGWGSVLVVVGAATAVLGAVLAIRQTDLKRLLAYTTVTVLGQLTMLIGTNTPYGLQAFAVYLLAHSLYKGALFMAAGAVDHATGTRQIARLGGLIRFMPLTGAAVALAAFSNAGLPPFFGFIAKEFKYSGLIELGPLGWVSTAVMIVTNALLLTAAGLVFIRVFLGRPGRFPRPPHEVSMPMWLGPLLLALGGFLLGAFNKLPEVWVVNAAVQAVSHGPVDVNLYLWGGITPALVASALTTVLGVLGYLYRYRLRRRLNRLRVLWRISGDLIWDRMLKRLFTFAGATAASFQHGSLRRHILLLVLVASAVMLAAAVPALGRSGLAWNASSLTPAAVVGCLLAVLGAGAAALMRGRLALVAALGLSGLGVALFFLGVNAPDVAITQFMVETLTVVFLGLVLRRLPPIGVVGSRSSLTRRLHAVVAVLFGVAVSLALIAVVSQPLPGDIASWLLAASLPQGHGANVVNVVLVDFRALDTLGEILVVALACAAAGTLLVRRRQAATQGGRVELDSPLLREGLKPLAGLLALVALVLLWRGHNLPGGGFIGALVAACAVVLIVLVLGSAAARRLLRVSALRLSAFGLLLAMVAGGVGLAAGTNYLTGAWIFPGGLPLGTPLMFDIGVFFTVFGAVVHLLFRLHDCEEG
ncbi:NADH-quinone oxidoreductase subunit I [Zoogloeaceae bacteirum Par-f-2]|nr:NADH-quinone oxidoreductase subunit I [Zoogloeaceae bacteirum Par-f-2]